MKRLFPRAVPEALVVLMLVGGACAPSSNVTPGAPVLKTLTIVSPNGTPHGTRYDVTPDTQLCPTTYAEGKDCDPTGFAICELGANVVCHCDGTDMCDPKKGTLTCTYDPQSYVVATFDRILDTTAFDAKKTVATLVAMPTSTAVAATDYTSSGSSTGLVFTQWSAPAFTGGYFADIVGPTIAMTGSPAVPTDSTVTFTLDPTLVQAKDGKTPFTGKGPLMDGIVAFKTSGFSASITVPAPPPPMDMSGGSTAPMTCPDAGTTSNMDGSTSETGSDAGTDGGSDSGSNADGGVDGDAAASEGGSEGGTTDAGTDTVVTLDAGTDAATDTGTDAIVTVDAGSDAVVATDAAADAASDAAAEAGTPPSTDVPADMNMGTIEIDFTNPVDMTVMDHIKITEDGQAFTDFTGPDPTKDFPTTAVKITPKTMWAAGKTYVVTVDADAADVLGKKLGAPVTASFTMSAN
jgi:hypothetical protein